MPLEHLSFIIFRENLENTETTYDPYLIGLDDERSLIYDRINTRVDKMVEHGLLEEAKWLYDNYPDAQSARGIGLQKSCFLILLGTKPWTKPWKNSSKIRVDLLNGN